MFKNVLVPLDGSPEAAAALPLADALARVAGAEVDLIRVVPPPALFAPPDDGSLADARDYLADVAKGLTADHLSVETVVHRGPVSEEIMAEAEARGADLIVMTTHGRSGLGRAILGSVAERLVAGSQIPVMLMRPEARPVAGIKTLLVPVDGTPGGAVALGAAVGLARASGARISLLQVITPIPAYVYAAPPVVAGYNIYVDPRWEEEARSGARHYLAGLIAQLERAGLAAEGRVVYGYAAEQIVEIADQLSADVIVMSTHALTGVARAMLGSVADEVLRTASRPVMLVRQDAPVSTLADLDGRARVGEHEATTLAG